MTEAIERDGFVVVHDVFDGNKVDALLAALESTARGDSIRRQGILYAMRNLLAVPEVRALATLPVVRALVEPVLGPPCFAVRGILFDKTPEANWKVVWHQDLSIAVRTQTSADGFGVWSTKAGVTHVQPPVGILERMLTVRLHLDDFDHTNGPLRVIAGSHREGRLDLESIKRWREQGSETTCLVPRGGALLMRPLLLHASSPAETPRHRRVIHLEFAADPLPDGLQWFDPVPDRS